MDRVYIRGVDFLPAKIKGVVVKNYDDDFIVFINALLCDKTQQKAVNHELEHIKLLHFYDREPVVINELDCK